MDSDMARILDCTVRSRRPADRYARGGEFLLGPLQNPSATSAGISGCLVLVAFSIQYSSRKPSRMFHQSDSRSFLPTSPWQFPLRTLIAIGLTGFLAFSYPPAGGGRRAPQN